MARLPWTKFQDFYLRLGFLKVLVAVLNPQRRSALNDQIVRRLEVPLFDPAIRHDGIWERLRPRMPWYPRKTSAGKQLEYPEIAEAMLVDHMADSILYGITRDTAYKILDWGRNVEFVGRGNQITERALVLRHLLPEDSIDRFLGGDISAWNPFGLKSEERLFFLYHLTEIDRVTVALIDDLSQVAPSSTLESSDAGRLTCHALFRVLNECRDHVEPRYIPAYRTARELACAIALELGLNEYSAECEHTARRRPPKPVKISTKPRGLATKTSSAKTRRTTKNSDHQTIPRFEQLVDLGFLKKPPDGEGDAEQRQLAGRRRWRYIPTDACRKWAAVCESVPQGESFKWRHFARASVSAFGRSPAAESSKPRPLIVAEYLWKAYERVRRPIGYTPADSVALFGTLTAATAGTVIELGDFHDLLLAIKKHSVLPQHASFASGNELDTMFIQLKPGFLEQVQSSLDVLETRQQ
jgi:hypothetical protein